MFFRPPLQPSASSLTLSVFWASVLPSFSRSRVFGSCRSNKFAISWCGVPLFPVSTHDERIASWVLLGGLAWSPNRSLQQRIEGLVDSPNRSLQQRIEGLVDSMPRPCRSGGSNTRLRGKLSSYIPHLDIWLLWPLVLVMRPGSILGWLV